MSYKEAAKYLPEAEDRGVSVVARGKDGFMGVYKREKTSRNMRTAMYSKKQSWENRRAGFISRHMAQYVKNPTRRRWLALIMWAYRPPGKAPPK
jgi:hypothetical protein